jgi:translation initiation factor IF-2
VVIKTKIASLKHLKDTVNKITAGNECGIILEKYNDVKAGDVIQSYQIVQVKKSTNV